MFISEDKVNYPLACIHQLFEQQVTQTPNLLAVVDEHTQLTYQQLNQQVNQLAHYLRSLKIKEQSPIGLCLERSTRVIVAILGILKVGGIYVPLEPRYPPERLRFMLADAQLAALITEQQWLTQLPRLDRPVLCLDRDWESQIAKHNSVNPHHTTVPEQLAYIIYTSGSTGQPKGVCCRHQGVPNLLADFQRKQPIEPGDACSLWAALSFDASVYEIWSALLAGGTLHIVPPALRTDTEYLLKWLDEHRIRSAYLPAAMLSALVEWQTHHQLTLRRLMVGAEPIPEQLLLTLAAKTPKLHIINAYGPTEATICATLYSIPKISGSLLNDNHGKKTPTVRNAPIGRAVSNTILYVLDEQLQPVAGGEAGELYIGGIGLAQGYWNRPALTAEKFIPNPFSEDQDARLYRTGDKVKYLPDGNLYFIGRIDQQIKLRGIRIEPGEIEATIQQYPGVYDALVMVQEVALYDARLVAYVVVKTELLEQSDFNIQLRAFLTDYLPEHLLPAAIIPLPAFPQTPNGKIDREALPLPQWGKHEAVVQPRTSTEIKVFMVWSTVLKISRFSIHDNFFELGGHSLLASQVISRLREVFQLDLSTIHLFNNPTVVTLAAQIDSQLDFGLLAVTISKISTLSPDKGQESIQPLSSNQQSFWLFEQFHQQTPTYHIPLAFHLTGTPQLSALEQALSEMVRRHTILRTTFELDEYDKPCQRIKPPNPVRVKVITTPTKSIEGVKLQLQAEIRRPFNLTTDHLFRVTVVHLDEQEQILLLLFHHLITDGWSVGLFIKELMALYAVYLEHQTLPATSYYQYVDFCHWQAQWLQSPSFETQLAYWQTQLAAPLLVLELPTDYPRPAVQTYRGARQAIQIAPSLTAALRQLSYQQSTTLFMTLLAAFKTLLYRYTGQSDLLVGTATAGRQRVEWEQVLGLFTNTLILRSQATGQQPFTTFLHQIRDVALAAYQHQDLSYQILIDKLHPERSLSYNPLFQTFFLLQNFAWPNLELTGLTTTPIAINTGTAKFDLTLELYERADYLEGWFEYNTDLFNASTIQRLEKHLQTLLADIVANPEQSLSRLRILTEAERNQLRVPPKLIRPVNAFIEFTQAEIEQSIPERFAQQVNKYPHHFAVKTSSTQLTYQQLHQQANQVAQTLLSVVNSEPPHVALLFEHDATMIVAIMGVLSAGLTYVPLTPDLPFQRLLHILQDSQAPVLLTHNQHLALAQELTSTTSKLINIDDLKATSVAKLPIAISPDTHAYLLYTSGTTGQPKGVIQNHRNVLHFIRNYTNNLHINTQDRLSLLSTYSFDAAIMDIFAALLNGATLCPINLKDDYQAYSLQDLIRQLGITIYHSTPTVYRHFISTLTASNRFPKIRLIVMGGEEVHQTDWVAYQQYFANHCLFVNGLGPTESTVTLQYFLNKQSINSQPTIPVGYPVAETEVSLMDDNGDVTELYGEIAIKSDYIALGYWQQPDLTQAAFPLDQNQRRYYRTGDLGRLRADGSIEFNGRKDSQVKLRGYRIELSEIEAILQQHPAVKESTAMIREDQPGLQQLVAYIVPPAEDLVIPSSHDFRQFLKEKLPDYMIPSAIMTLNAIPLLPNGKVNYHQLPIPVIESTTFVAPRNELEQRLGQIWEQLLNISTIGIHDNFFNLGGHSLLAVTLINHIDKQFGRRLPLVSLFQAPTIAKQAELLQEQLASRSWSVLNPIQPHGSRPILFFLCPAHYLHNLSQVLGTEQPVYRLEILGLQSSHQQIFSLEIVTKRFIQEIQSLQPQGPYYIFGFCGLAKMAIELARQLQEQGHSIALLGLIQAVPYYPRWSFFQHWSQLWKIGPIIYLWRKLTRKFKLQKKRLTLWFSQISKTPYQQPQAENLSPQLEYIRFVNSFFDALNGYAMPPYRGNIVLFHASEWCAKNVIQLKLAQQVAAGKVEICEIPAKDYNRLCVTPHVELLGQQLQRYLEQSYSTESNHR
jgi:amino acid adenylation domain-containing protein